LKEQLEDDQKRNYIITSQELEDIMEESIRVFWEFVKGDKDETPTILKGLVGPQVELQDPSDYSLMMRLHSTLQKVLTNFSIWVLKRTKYMMLHPQILPEIHLQYRASFISQFNIDIKF
jgi:Protein of unknown function (DUF1666)